MKRNSIHMSKKMPLDNNTNQIKSLMDVLIIDAVATSVETKHQRAYIYKVIK